MVNVIRAPAVLVGQLMKKIQESRAPQNSVDKSSGDDNSRELGIPGLNE